MKHSPGPWTSDNGGDAFYGVFGPDGGALAYLLDVAPGVQWESAILPMDPAITIRERFAIHEANANLMAAAPEIADALGNVLQLLIALGLANAPTAPQMLAEYPQVIAARASLAKAGL